MHIRLTDLGHRFPGGEYLFRHLDAELTAGRMHAVIGPSGSGKSTFLAILAGWIRPSEGRVSRAGVHRCGWVLQNPHGVARRACLDHVSLPFLARGLRRSEADLRARELLERVGLAHVAERPFHTLSGGEAQRLMLARGMAAAPGLLLVDEPTAQLDGRTARAVDAALSRLAEPGVIVVVATHDARTAAVCDEVVDLGRWVP